MIYRSYQKRMILEALESIGKGNNVLIQAPTGAGKTVIGSAVCRVATELGEPSAFFCHRTELRDQSHRKLVDSGCFVGDLGVTVGSIQQFSITPARIRATLIVIDEYHHISGDGVWRALVDYNPQATIVGLSATPNRTDGKALTGVDDIVLGPQPSVLIAEGSLVPSSVWATREPGDVLYALQTVPHELPAVVFCGSVERAKKVANRLPRSAVVHDNLSAKKRAAIISAFDRREIDYICNQGILTEGWDSPMVRTVAIEQRCASAGGFLQKCGRGARPYPGKVYYTLIDAGANVWIHGMPEADRAWSLKGKQGTCTNEHLSALTQCLKCGAVFESSSQCPRCGLVIPKPVPKTREELELEALTAERIAKEKNEAAIRAIRAVGNRKGYKPGWAQRVLKAKGIQ